MLDIEPGTHIRLEGKTRHGKNRIREHGEWWELIQSTLVPPPNDLFCVSLQTQEVRWVKDKDFRIVEVREINDGAS